MVAVPEEPVLTSLGKNSLSHTVGFSGGSAGIESSQCRRPGFDTDGEDPGERKSYPLQYSHNFHFHLQCLDSLIY